MVKLFIKGTEMITTEEVRDYALDKFKGHDDVYVILNNCCSHGTPIGTTCDLCIEEQDQAWCEDMGFYKRS